MASGRCEHSISGGNDIVPDLPCKKCEESDTFIEAIAYCRQCNESYCKLCLRDHNRFIKGHTVLGQAEKDDWGKPIVSHFQGIGVECSEHEGQDISLYCGLHDNVCCPVCAVLHHSDKCKPKMLYIRKAAQGLATSADYLHFMTTNDQLCARITKTEGNISEHMTALGESRKTCKSDAEELCKRLTEHIKKCTDNSIAHINHIHDNVEWKLAEEIVTCADMKQKLDDIRSSMQIKGPLDESFAFVTMKTHKGELQRYERSLRMLGKTTSNSYTFQGSAVIQQLTRSNELGDCTENAADVASDVLNPADPVSGSAHGQNDMFAGVEVKLEAQIQKMPRGSHPVPQSPAHQDADEPVTSSLTSQPGTKQQQQQQKPLTDSRIQHTVTQQQQKNPITSVEGGKMPGSHYDTEKTVLSSSSSFEDIPDDGESGMMDQHVPATTNLPTHSMVPTKADTSDATHTPQCSNFKIIEVFGYYMLEVGQMKHVQFPYSFKTGRNIKLFDKNFVKDEDGTLFQIKQKAFGKIIITPVEAAGSASDEEESSQGRDSLPDEQSSLTASLQDKRGDQKKHPTAQTTHVGTQRSDNKFQMSEIDQNLVQL